MKMVVIILVVMLGILALHTGTAGAVAADETGLGFNEQGTKIVGAGRNVWVPVVVILGGLGLGTLILIGGRIAGFAFRYVLACAIFAIIITGTALTTLFPNLIVAFTLP